MMKITTIITAARIIFSLAISLVSSEQIPVNLGSAANFVLFAQSAITAEGTTTIRGNVGLRPATTTAIIGFGLQNYANDRTYSLSPIVAGKVYSEGHAAPTPAFLLTASLDMEAAYNDASSRSNPDYSNHADGSINGLSLSQGLYKWTTSVTISGTVTITGTSADVFVFQTDGTLTFNDDTRIVLQGGVRSTNIFWVAAETITVGAGSSITGIILGKTNIVFNTAARLFDGRVLVQTFVTLICTLISQPQPLCRPTQTKRTCDGRITNLDTGRTCNNCLQQAEKACYPKRRTWVITKVQKTHGYNLVKNLVPKPQSVPACPH